MIYRHTTNLLLINIVLGSVEGNVFVEEMTASYTAIVAIVNQVSKHISYFSRNLSQTECKLSSIEEACARIDVV